jgi:hypothetical protein
MSINGMSTAQGHAFGLNLSRKYPIHARLNVSSYEDADILKLRLLTE